MKKQFEKLDMSMKKNMMEMIKYGEDSANYKQLLPQLNQNYQAVKRLLDLTASDINTPYFFIYSNLEDVESILENAGYIEKQKQNNI